MPCRRQPVAPHVGAWIETLYKFIVKYGYKVAPHVGAWIETSKEGYYNSFSVSHPMWVRGLKLLFLRHQCGSYSVAPHVGAWIET